MSNCFVVEVEGIQETLDKTARGACKTTEDLAMNEMKGKEEVSLSKKEAHHWSLGSLLQLGCL